MDQHKAETPIRIPASLPSASPGASPCRCTLAPPALLLLLLSPHNWYTVEKRLYCLEDDDLLHIPIPSRLRQMMFNGSYDGGWITATPRHDPNPIVIVNLFSGAEVTLSEKQRTISCPRHNNQHRRPPIIWRIIFSEAPTSSSCILAASTCDCGIALCKLGCPDGGWTMERCGKEVLWDITFCRGELYGMMEGSECILKFDIGVNDQGAPVITTTHLLAVKARDGPRREGKSYFEYTSYIFELRGNLAMAVRTVWSPNSKPFFKVYELTCAGTYEDKHIWYKWSEVHHLGDYALFFGPRFSSKAVHVPTGACGGVEKNHIYYSNHRWLLSKEGEELAGKSYLTRSVDGFNIYFREKQYIGDGGGDMERIPSVGYYVFGDYDVPMWCFPPEL